MVGDGEREQAVTEEEDMTLTRGKMWVVGSSPMVLNCQFESRVPPG